MIHGQVVERGQSHLIAAVPFDKNAFRMARELARQGHDDLALEACRFALAISTAPGQRLKVRSYELLSRIAGWRRTVAGEEVLWKVLRRRGTMGA